MSRAKIAEHISNEIGFSRSDSLEIIELILGSIVESVASDEILKIPKFGTFSVKRKNSRFCTELGTGKRIIVEARNTVSFKASSTLRKKINQ